MSCTSCVFLSEYLPIKNKSKYNFPWHFLWLFNLSACLLVERDIEIDSKSFIGDLINLNPGSEMLTLQIFR